MQGKGVESIELEELLRSLQLIEQIQLPVDSDNYIERFFTQREKEAIERRVKGARKAKKKGIKLGRQGAAPGRQHWSAKRKRIREYYRKIAYPRMLRKLSQLVESEGWYDVMVRGWKQSGWEIKLSREEWNTHVEPLLRENKAVPYTERYYTNVPVISLDNILIYHRGANRGPNRAGYRARNEKPIFDGAEWKMKQMGYIM